MRELTMVFLALSAALCFAMALVTWLANRRLRHLRLMDHLLTKLCVEAFAMQRGPIWAAWSGTMGEINVEVSARRKEWGDG